MSYHRQNCKNISGLAPKSAEIDVIIQRTDEQKDKQSVGRIDERTDGRKYVRMDVGANVRMEELIEGWW